MEPKGRSGINPLASGASGCSTAGQVDKLTPQLSHGLRCWCCLWAQTDHSCYWRPHTTHGEKTVLLGSDTNSWSAVQFFFIIINLVNPLLLLKICPVALTTLGLGMFIWLGPFVSPHRSFHNQKKWENGLLRLAPCIIYQESCSLSSPWKKQMRQLEFVPTDPNRPKHRQSFF